MRGVLIVYTDEDLRAQIIYIVKHKLRIIDDAFMKKVFEGQSEINALNRILIKAGRFDDLARATEDAAYQQKLMAELLPTA